MKRLLSLGAATICALTFNAVTAQAKGHDGWRVLMVTGQVSGAQGGSTSDSFPVSGNLENCRQIALTLKDSLALKKGAAMSLFCLDTTTGKAVNIDTHTY